MFYMWQSYVFKVIDVYIDRLNTYSVATVGSFLTFCNEIRIVTMKAIDATGIVLPLVDCEHNNTGYREAIHQKKKGYISVLTCCSIL